MSSKIKLIFALSLAFGGTACSPTADVVPASALAAGAKLVAEGREGIPACAGCHGKAGEGVAIFPRLAGQDPRYIERQLADFARELPPAGVVREPIARDYSETPRIYADLTVFTPGVRQDAVMTPIAKGLTAEERQSLALYLASLPFTAKPKEADFQTLERGQDLALRGKPEYGLPGCIACHGPNGEGLGGDFPPLAGQPPEYLVGQIDRWQRGGRDNDPMGLMRSVAQKLTEADKRNVAAYFANRSFAWPGYTGPSPWASAP